ncbi:MAG: phosphatase PAP2 family protein [bacterium]
MTTEKLSRKSGADAGDTPEKFGRFEEMDRRAMLFLYRRLRNPVFDLLMPFLSVICNKGALHIVAGALMIICGHFAKLPKLQSAGVVLMAAAGSAFFIAELPIKQIWKRKRPFMVMEEVLPKVPHKRLLKRPSFPSGHASGYFAGGVALSICYPSLATAFLCIAALGSFSRIYNGVHFPSDVIAGSLIGAAFGAALTPFLLPALMKAF